MHISDHFVVVYIVFRDLFLFVEIDHHDRAYMTVEGLIVRLTEDKKLLSALQRMGISRDEFTQFMRPLGGNPMPGYYDYESMTNIGFISSTPSLH